MECIDRHAPLKRIKITRPPAPWLHDQEIEQLQNERNLLRHLAHSTKTADAWKAFRKVRNLLKTKIKEAKRSFINIALSSSKPKAVWRVIHRILNPCPQPLRFDVDELNDHFAGTSTRTAGASTIDTKEDLMNFIGSIDSETPVEQQFTLRPVTREEVLREIKRICLDPFTGPDQIPARFIKPVAQFIASPLTVIINAFISKSTFPKAWKVARVTPIPKNSNNPTSASNLRPISILPVLSKVYEKLIQHQVISYIDAYALYKNNISGFRKGHSATTVLLGSKDDIKHAMKRGEVTLMIMADYSKAFDTIKFRTVLSILNDFGFSKDYLKWTVNYLTGRKHFVQVDDKKSNCCNVSFGGPQGSIMGPLIFNLYVPDLPSCIPDASCH